jgi:exonuclease SbcD
MTGSFSFIHAADLHIDSPLRGLSNYEGAPAERLRLATREAFQAVVGQALERRVDFVVLAGDLFDGDWPDFESGLWFGARMNELGVAGIEVFIIRGNHDAASKISRNLRAPEHVHFFPGSKPKTFKRKKWGVVLHGQSYEDAATTDNLAVEYPVAVENAFNIGVLHTALQGREGHGTYAPCTVGELKAKGYDYWALGHVHNREVVSEDPWIVFPGNTQGRHARELGPKSATLVTVVEGSVTSVEELISDVARWDHVRVDLTGTESEDQLIQRLVEGLKASQKAAGDRLLAVRVTFEGSTSLDNSLRLDQVRLTAEVRAQGTRLSAEIWVEKVIFKTSPRASGQEASAELSVLAQRLSRAELSEEDLAHLTRRFAKLSDKLPAAVRETIHPGNRAHLAAAFDPAQRFLAALMANPETPATREESQ